MDPSVAHQNPPYDLTRMQEQPCDIDHFNENTQKRIEDSNKPIDYRVIIRSLDGALVSELKELEDSCLAIANGRQATEKEKKRASRTLRVLHGHLDCMQELLDMTPLPPETDQAAATKVELAMLGMVALSVTSIIIEVQMQHFSCVQRVGALLCSSLFFMVMAQIFVLSPYYQQREKGLRGSNSQ